jgi:NitT/TauT family transport system ATP-binding protein
MSAPTAATRSGHIEVRDLNISFKANGATVQAVKSVSLEVQAGEFVSLIGPSGCGKSTLMNAVAGFTPPDSGVVFQQYSLFPWMTVRKNVEFGLKMAHMPPSQRETQARTLLGLAGLLAFENHYPSQLSGGMKQRVGIVRALATSPQVLLMDEPFGALDSQTRTVMQEILTNMWQRLRLSVLFITHDIEEAIFLSDRIYVMTARPGRIKAEIKVPLPRPRTPDMVDTPEFAGLVRSIKKLIREESLAAMGGELRGGGYAGLSTDIGPEGVAHVL